MNTDLHEAFWAANIEELAKCYKSTDGGYHCLICGKHFEQGLIYPVDERLMDAERATQEHVVTEHQGALAFLLTLDKKYTGLSDNQTGILQCLAEHLDDQTIAARLGITSATVRNHRFRLREKAKQARVFLAMMENIDMRKKESDLVEIHRTATVVDERYATTRREREKILKNHIDQGGRLTSFPSKEKKKIIILSHLIERFDAAMEYTESEVNDIIATFYNDYATLRRYLIQYGFMEREDNGSAYRVKR